MLGLGGVGSAAAEALCRAGVGHLLLVDHDTVDETNLNRQLVATRDAVGMRKADAELRRLGSIHPAGDFTAAYEFYLPDNSGFLFDWRPDFVLDCIDTVTAKLHLAEACARRGVPLYMCLGTGQPARPRRAAHRRHRGHGRLRLRARAGDASGAETARRGPPDGALFGRGARQSRLPRGARKARAGKHRVRAARGRVPARLPGGPRRWDFRGTKKRAPSKTGRRRSLHVKTPPYRCPASCKPPSLDKSGYARSRVSSSLRPIVRWGGLHSARGKELPKYSCWSIKGRTVGYGRELRH